jgi:hypothetical protein
MIKQQTTADYFKAFNILFIALMTGQILFAVIIFILTVFTNGKIMLQQEAQLFTYIVAALTFICIAINWSLFKKRIELIKQELELSKQLNDYRALYIMRFALAEAPTLFSIIIVFITGNRLIWLFVVIGIFSGISLRPSKERLIKELQLGSDDIDKLNDPDAAVTEIEVKR